VVRGVQAALQRHASATEIASSDAKPQRQIHKIFLDSAFWYRNTEKK
jgi:hypothetical protein